MSRKKDKGRPSDELIHWLSSEIEVGLRRGWPDHICVMYGRLLEVKGMTQIEELERMSADFCPAVKASLWQSQKSLADKFSIRAGELDQLIRSECALVYEELISFLTTRSDFIFADGTLHEIGLEKLVLIQPPLDHELRAYLCDHEHEYPPGSWPKNVVDCMDLSRHWWWTLSPKLKRRSG